LNTVSEKKALPNNIEPRYSWSTITIKAPLLQTGGQTPKEFQTEYIQSSKYAARLKSSGYQAIPKVVEKDLAK
jgi:hypothetical protein